MEDKRYITRSVTLSTGSEFILKEGDIILCSAPDPLSIYSVHLYYLELIKEN